MTRLTVYWNGVTVGALSRSESSGLRFAYADAYLSQGGAVISCALPPDNSFEPATAAAWFGNLLPEGSVRESLCRSLRIDYEDDFALLAALGRDCAGALAIVPEGDLAPDDTPVYEPMGEFELAQRVENNRASPLLGLPGEQLRLSLAGAQSKLALTLIDGIPHKACSGPTTHILKPAQQGYPGLCFNEYFCAQLAAEVRLDVPETTLVGYRYFREGPEEFAFAIQRYDRAMQGDHVVRRHQEDFCQGMGWPRQRKYDATLSDFVALLRRHARVPALEIDKLLRSVMFNLIVGNRDAHAKNYSLLLEKGQIRLAPLYDLVCTVLYPSFSSELPQPLAAARQLEAINLDTWPQFAAQIQVTPRTVVGVIRSIAMHVTESVHTVDARLRARPGYNAEIAAAITRIVHQNCSQLTATLPS